MFAKFAQAAASIVIVVASAAALWSQFGNNRANNLVKEANALVELGQKQHNEAVPKFNALVEALHDFPANRAELEAPARELGEMYGRTAEQFRQAAAKLDEASKRPTDPVVVEYFTLRSRKWAKTAEARELVRQYVLLVVDPTVRTPEELAARQSELDERISVIVQEEKSLEEASTKIENENSSKFD